MKKILLLLIIIQIFPILAIAQNGNAKEDKRQGNRQYPVEGRVISATDGQPLPGASVIIKGTTIGTVTGKEGTFMLKLREGETVLGISFIGFNGREITVSPPVEKPLEISLEEDIFSLGEVEIVSTGYQQLPKERATGSFVQIDNDLLNRATGSNILNRLKAVTSGVSFNPGSGTDPISIRGRSTLFANAKPLIIVDNFSYEGDINNINPNDVESITILKDAAASSIWGARAGNGVIVITTKEGKYNQAPQVSFKSNFMVEESPDPFYEPRMSVDDYIETEQALFEAGYYTYRENAIDHRALSPAVELLIAKRDGEITEEEVGERMAALRKQDVRRDFEKYLYRKSIGQQYAVNVKGGDERQRYFFSAGYDRNRKSLVGDRSQRITLSAKNNWSFFEDKLLLSGDIYFTQSKDLHNGINPLSIRLSTYDVLPPYTRLVDALGNPLNITQDYRTTFIEEARAKGFLDWRYNILREIELVDKVSNSKDYRADAEIRYRVIPSLEASVRYRYWYNLAEVLDLYPEESYYVRDLVNRYTQMGPDGDLIRPVPAGGILDNAWLASTGHNIRAQLDFSKSFNGKHEVNVMGGYEVRELVTKGHGVRYYGYEGDRVNSVRVDYTTRYPLYNYQYSILSIPNKDSHTSLTDRFVSWYANASYVYDHRYVLSASARKDKSNLFGVDANQKGVPLWSAGIGWNVSEEAFYGSRWLPFLKFRITYGHSGNIDKRVTAFATAQIMGNSSNSGLLYAQVTNPANPDLRWERVEMMNFGLDFATQGNRVSGSLEYYIKEGHDLIGFAPLAPSTGQREFKANTAETTGQGVDIALSTMNIDNVFKWQTDLLFSSVNMEVKEYKKEETNADYLLNYGHFGNSPQEGKPLFVFYSYPWAGLDSGTGDPQGYLNGEISTDYGAIISNATVDSLYYHGPARPPVFGAVRNTFSWKNFSLSINISYRLGHYFRRKSIFYGYNQGLGGHGDYGLRWRKPGDEAFTQVPSLPESGNYYRDRFYTNSAILVEKADNIRLQDIALSYLLNKANVPGLPFESISIYAYAQNLGILWKTTDKVPDPEYLRTNALTSYSLGLEVNF